MKPADDSSSSTHLRSDAAAAPKITAISQPGRSKEIEGAPLTADIKQEIAQEVNVEISLPKEVEQSGVLVTPEKLEIPPDLQKIGVTQTSVSSPIAYDPSQLPAVQLPISDDTVVKGLHEKFTNALRWLAEWSLRKLKKAHLTLKVIHGKVTRVKI